MRQGLEIAAYMTIRPYRGSKRLASARLGPVTVMRWDKSSIWRMLIAGSRMACWPLEIVTELEDPFDTERVEGVGASGLRNSVLCEGATPVGVKMTGSIVVGVSCGARVVVGRAARSVGFW